MKYTLLAIVAIGIASSSLAGLPYDPFSSAASHYSRSAASSAFVVVPADAREFKIDIKTEQRGLNDQLAELIAARSLLHSTLEQIDKSTRFDTSEPRFSGKDNLVSITAVYAMPKDILLHTQKIVDAVAGIQLPEGAKFTYSIKTARSKVSEPEKHRKAVTAKALAHLKQFKEQAEHFTVKVEGLQKTLDIVRKNENQFSISLDYSVQLESNSSKKEATAAQGRPAQ
jgi:hypothetical protein